MLRDLEEIDALEIFILPEFRWIEGRAANLNVLGVFVMGGQIFNERHAVWYRHTLIIRQRECEPAGSGLSVF